MSDQIVQMANDTKETDIQFMQTYQCVWMSRWKRTSCNSTIQAHNGSSNTVRKMELDHTTGDNCADKMKASGSVTRHDEIVNNTFEIVNESLRKEGMEFQDLPMVSPANCGSGFLFKVGQDTDDVGTSRCPSSDNSDRVKAVTCEAEIQFPGILASNDVSFKEFKYGDGSTSKNPPKWTQSHSSAKDSTSAVSKSLWESFVKPSAVTSPFIFECQHSEFDEGETSVPSSIGRSAIISSNQLIDATLRLGKHEYQHNHKVDNHSQPRNSVTVSFRESNTSSIFDPPSMSGHHLSELRLFPSQFNASQKTEGKGKYVKDSEVTAKNESSVEEKDPLSGAISTPSKKVNNMLMHENGEAIYMDLKSPCQAFVASSKQIEFERPNTKLCNINLDLRPLPATVTSSENWDPLSSKTQSLKMDTKQPKQHPIPCLDNSPVANPGNRCVKRLKLSSSHSTAQGTKSSSKDEPSFEEKLNKNFGTICGSAVIFFEPTLAKTRGKDQYFSVNPPEKDQELLLSHAWIKRWQRSGSTSTTKESSTVVFCDPRSSNLTLNGLQNEQFPSIAAMALMGRAMNGFQPFEVQKRGSLTVWNSRAL